MWWSLWLACGGPEPRRAVVLVVLDTVRADHLSACGYGRPTSPTLAALAEEGALRCDVVAPSAWTLPSHASFFTGLTPAEHGVVATDEGHRLARDIHVRPLDVSVETLAERYAAQGWHTALVSGNALLGGAGGLQQGFAHVDAGGLDPAEALRGPRLGRAVRAALAEAPADKSLLLVVNVMDAHDPWPATAEGAWGPARPRVGYQHRDEGSAYVRFHRGALPPDERAAYLALVADQYDRAVFRADAQLADVMDALRASGRLGDPHRLVVTSDHGELLGEHGRLRHGGDLWEENLRVPLLWIESPGPSPVLDGPVSGREVFSLLARGARDPGAVLAFAEPSEAHPDPGIWGVARYDGAAKFVVTESGAARFDLASDPGELAPTPVAAAAEDAAALGAWRAAPDRPFDAAGDDGEALRALGYVE